MTDDGTNGANTRSDDLGSPWPHSAMTQDDDLDAARGGPEYGPLHAAHRLLNDRLSGAALPRDLERDVTATLTELNDLLAGYQVVEHDRIDGLRPDLPGRGHPLVPPFIVDEDAPGGGPGTMRGRVTYTRFHLGGGAAVHGGTQPLLFDDVLGRLVNLGMDTIARTAYLKVDYRHVTPLDVELFWEVSLVRIDGRKRWTSGRLTDADGVLLAEVEGLFVELLPGQP